MADVFERVYGQPQVRDFFRAACANGRVSHAYLFVGPAGSNKTQAAYALAQALMCGAGGCSEASSACETCRRVQRKSHPDVRYYAPEGAGGYLVEQMRGIVNDTAMAPIQGKRKIYILDRVDLLGTASANAFLKTLEEPPANVTLILLARTRESVLPTILSRCVVVPFRHIPPSEAVGIICQNASVSPEKARVALEACGGSISDAAQFAASADSMAFRGQVMGVLNRLRQSDDWDIVQAAAQLLEASKVPLDEVRRAQERELEDNADFLASAAKRQIEQRNKRVLTAQANLALRRLLAMISSWLRDVLVVCAESSQLIVNNDVASGIQDAAAHTNEARVVRASCAVDRAREAITYNVSPETCIDALLFEVREELYGSGSPD